MLKKTITYNDLDGNKLVEDFYFNISGAEITELAGAEENVLLQSIEKIQQKAKPGDVVSALKEIISFSVGRRSENGKSFIKSDDIRTEFLYSDAYSELLLELLTHPLETIEFVNGVIPADLDRHIEAAKKADEEMPAWIREDREPTDAEMRKATPGQKRLAMQMREARKNGEKV